MLATLAKWSAVCVSKSLKWNFKAIDKHWSSYFKICDLNHNCLQRVTVIQPLNTLQPCLFPYSTAVGSQDVSYDTIRSQEETTDFLTKHNIVISGSDCPSPIVTIEEACFPDHIKDILRQNGIKEPTPVQAIAWSLALNEFDVVGISQTGSGKTLAFVLPAIMHILKVRKTCDSLPSPFVLVVAPTRELVQQTEKVFKLFTPGSIRCVAVYGGEKPIHQLKNMRNGFDVCVATPGRCRDFMESSNLTLDRCSLLILDEADRMLDMGFLPQIEYIFDEIQIEKQVMMWSATWPKEVRSIAKRFLKEFTLFSVGSTDLRPNPNIRQEILICNNNSEKKERLVEKLTLLNDGKEKVLIFVEQKIYVDGIANFLRRKGFRVLPIHGDMSQHMRNIALQSFHSGRCNILVATAVASRGLDINDVGLVINFDCPKTSEEYIHKIGRTARHSKTGTALTLVTPQDSSANYLIPFLKENCQEIPEQLYEITRNANFSNKRINSYEYRNTRNYNRRNYGGKNWLFERRGFSD